MRLWLRLGLGLLGLVVALLAVAALVLPGILQSDDVRGQVEAAAESALGRDVSLGALDIGLLPPSLLVSELRVAGATPVAPPLLEAREVALELGLLPLLAGTVLVDSLGIDGARVHLVRTAAGIDLPSGDDPTPAPATAPAEDSSLTLAVRQVELSGATLVFEDQVVSPATTTRLEAEAVARGRSLREPVDLDLTLTLGQGASSGALRMSGSATAGGALDLMIALEGVALAPFAPYAGAEPGALGGTLGGRIGVTGSSTNPDVDLDLTLVDSEVDVGGGRVRGPVTLTARLAQVATRLAGPFEVDAGAAHVELEGVLDKAPGRKLLLSGRIEPGDAAPVIEDLHVALATLEMTGGLHLAPSLRADLRTNAVDLAAWKGLLPPLGDAPLRGGFEVERLRVATDPLALDGRVLVQSLTADLPERGPVVLDGALHFEGDVVRSEDLVATLAGQAFALDLRAEQVFEALHYEARVEAREADVDALITAFAGRPDTLMGPLNVTGRVFGRVEDGRSPLETLKAELDFEIARGKLVGVSILQAAMGDLGRVAVDAGNLFAGPEIARFYSEEFELMKGVLRLDGGVGHSRPLSIQYRDYGVELVGDLDLAELRIDMEGRLVLFEAIDRVIARKAGAKQDYQPRRRDIPLAAVTGSLGAPQVEVAAASAARFASLYARDVFGDRLRARIDDKLGAGAGKLVEGALEGLFGGGRKKSRTQAEP